MNIKLIVIITLSFISSIANSSTGIGLAQARFLVPLAMNETHAMNFGIILPDPAGDTVWLGFDEINSPGNSTFSGGNVHSRFTITGEPNSVVNLSVTSSTALIGPGESMAIGTFTNSTWNPTLDSNGYFLSHLGASLIINANQSPGVYSGSYTVNVNYQ